ncbi:DUF6624 domain-containing protein [Dyadobacter psychrotolerans]|uniref:GLPGLI family protein n=1 Tax=Dyadobacter psychrotolerans TaxID=2541721 RepID=A0A4V2Z528_9BACT|nr:DUF6624 domain-containing protein [Dyadobacter psychrotolerans]TDE18668.1 hypothetical protein E0F88_03785 [Dyadobacter psychrotolerans]
MKFVFTLALILTAGFQLAAQTINIPLKKELDSIYVLDQKYRELLSIAQKPKEADSLAAVYHVQKERLSDHLWTLQTEVDESNITRIDAIVKQYGYPGESLVGSPANEAVFYVIQHSEKIDQYLPVVEKAAKENQLPFRLFAMMKDRSLMQNEKEQIYGTQASGFSAINKATGKAEWTWIIWPIIDPVNVNKRRKEAGFEQTVEENAKRLNVDYKVLTIEEVNKMKVR